MTDGEIVVITLELRAGAEPIAGSARIDGGPLRSFRGWLELTTLISTAAEGRARPPAAQDGAGQAGAGQAGEPS